MAHVPELLRHVRDMVDAFLIRGRGRSGTMCGGQW